MIRSPYGLPKLPLHIKPQMLMAYEKEHPMRGHLAAWDSNPASRLHTINVQELCPRVTNTLTIMCKYHTPLKAQLEI
jgi:hypothetical protein